MTVLTVLDMKNNILFNFCPSFRTFFHGSGFFWIGFGFWLIRIRTQKKKSDPDPDPGNKPGSETLRIIQFKVLGMQM